jgi:two-component system, LytTR family, response regulator
LTTSVLLVDDEPLARKKLRDLVASVDWLSSVGEAGNGPDAVAALDRLGPDLVLLDLELPGWDGFEVLRRCARPPGVIFTTAYSRYAVRAFEVHALDYLLKPFDRARFLDAMARARAHLDQSDGPPQADRLNALAAGPGLRQLYVRQGSRIVVVPVARIEYLEASRDYVEVHAPPERYRVHLTLSAIADQLPAPRFVRIHRSLVVNIEMVTELRPHGNAQLELLLRSGVWLRSSRSYARGLRDLVL